MTKPPQPPTRSGTSRLSDTARHVVVPKGITSTGWPAVREKCGQLGIAFDDWQDGAGRIILAKRKDGTYAATVGGTVISIPRQVGKTYLIGAIVFALCLLFPNLTVIWTAHRLRTADETFASMLAMSQRRKIAPHMLRPVLGSGEQAIRFRNRSRILFGARERGFGRGFAAVDVLVFDEAQILTEAAIDDMVPATNQAKHPAGALLLFTGTPPKPTDPGEVFSRKRREALSGEDGDTAYIEFSADEDCALTDRAQWRKANPSHPKRTPVAAMLRMIKNLGVDAAYREMLGRWDDPDKTRAAISYTAWTALKTKDAAPVTRAQLVIAAATDGKRATIALATETLDGRTLVLVDHGEGTTWTVEKTIKLANRAKLVEVAITPSAKHLSPALTKAKVEHKILTPGETDAGCPALLQWVTDGTITHVNQTELAAAIKNARTRTVGGVQRWDQRDPLVDISPVVAAAASAHRWRLNTAKPDTPPPPPRRARPTRQASGSVATAGF